VAGRSARLRPRRSVLWPRLCIPLPSDGRRADAGYALVASEPRQILA
jgi:hypothetical protein